MDLEEFSNVKAWKARLESREGVQKGLAVARAEREKLAIDKDKDAQSVLFGQRAR